jgi:hypothetical protein
LIGMKNFKIMFVYNISVYLRQIFATQEISQFCLPETQLRNPAIEYLYHCHFFELKFEIYACT